MSMTHEQPAVTGSRPAQDYPSWTGPGGPGGPSGPAGPGGGCPPPRRHRGLVIATSVSLAAAVVAGGLAWASAGGSRAAGR
jgi:hypothetical protein